MSEGGKQAIKADDEVVAAAEVRELKKRIRELERVPDRKTLENEILKEVVSVAHEKTDLAVAVIARRGFPVKAVAETFKVSRSNLILRQNGSGNPRRSYVKTDDTVLLPAIRPIVDERPTYDYRRVGALLNRERRSQGLPALNHKRLYRLMNQNGLLLAWQPQKRLERPHEGKVIALKSNLRWSSDGFETPCWNRAVVRVTFVIDISDREIIARGATTGGFDGETVRDLMLLWVERRFASHHTPHAVEWLTDNGSCYTAREPSHLASHWDSCHALRQFAARNRMGWRSRS